MTGMYQSRDIVSQGTIDLVTRGPRTFVLGHIVSERLVTPSAFIAVFWILISLNVDPDPEPDSGFYLNADPDSGF